jgi:hypothetical protein
MSSGYDKQVIREGEVRINLAGSPASAFQNLADGIQGCEDEIRRLLQSVPQNAAQMAAWQASVGSLAREMDRLAQVQNVVNLRAQGQNVATFQDVKRQEAAARAILEVSRALEDFSVAGWRGALNNIPMMMYSIGQSAGLTATQIASMTGVFSTVLVAATVLVQNWRGVWQDNLGKILENWDGFMEAIGERAANPTMLIGDVASGVEALGNAVLNAFAPTFENTLRTTLEKTKQEYEVAKRRVDELAKESRLTSAEMEELTYGRKKVEDLKAAYEAATAAAKFMKIVTEEAQTRADAVEKVTKATKGGPEQVQGVLAAAMREYHLKNLGRAVGDDDYYKNTASEMLGQASDASHPEARRQFGQVMRYLRASGDKEARGLYTKLLHETPEVQDQMKALEEQAKHDKAEAEKATKAKEKADREKEQKVRAAATPVAEGRRFEGPARIAELAAGGMDPVAAADQYAKELAAKIPQYGALTADVAKAASEKMLGEFESRRQELLAKGVDPGAIPARVKADMEAAEARAKTEAERAAEAAARAEGRDAKAADQRATKLAREYSDPFDEQIRAAVARNELMQAQFAGLPARMAAAMSRQQYGAAVQSDAALQASLASEVAARLQAVGARDDTGKAITPAEAQAVASKIVGDAVQDTNRRLAESAQMSTSMGEAALMLYRQTQADLQQVMADQALVLRQFHDAQSRRAHAPRNRP